LHGCTKDAFGHPLASRSFDPMDMDGDDGGANAGLSSTQPEMLGGGMLMAEVDMKRFKHRGGQINWISQLALGGEVSVCTGVPW
jgi:hypothetical protein